MEEVIEVATYSRVSTTKQEFENQLEQLKRYCNKMGWQIVKEYNETISGKEKNRPVFKEMMKDAQQKKFDIILVWALDRFSREGTSQIWHYISILNEARVRFVSYTEPYFNTDNEMVRDILLSVMGALAKQERIKISERTKAGLEQAKKKGIKLGKPNVPEKVKQEILKLRGEGKSYREIAKEVFYWDKSNHKKNVSVGFVHKTLSALPS